MRRVSSLKLPSALLALLSGLMVCAAAANALAATPCERPVYLTFDTGHMAVAPLVADVLNRHRVMATFFLADERTQTGGSSLDDSWAPWWKARAAEGHAFGSHTWDHDVWLADTAAGLRVKPTQGPAAGKARVLDAAAYCAELQRPAERFFAMTGERMGSVFRAPGGKTSPALLEAAAHCGWAHVGWSPAGFSGDELPSDKYPTPVLLQRMLRDVRQGDVLLVHLGIWSRRDAWAPQALEPLIVGLKKRGLCFATLRDNPQFAAAAGRAR